MPVESSFKISDLIRIQYPNKDAESLQRSIVQIKQTLENEEWYLGLIRGVQSATGFVDRFISLKDTPNRYSEGDILISGIDSLLWTTPTEELITDLDRVRWKNVWDNTIVYADNDMVRDGEWTMIANKETTDRPAPQPLGDAGYVYDGAAPTTSETVRVVVMGQEYKRLDNAFFVTGYRIFVVAGNRYEVVLVTDPGTPDEGVNFVNSFTAETTGWREFSTPQQIVAPKAPFRVLVIAQQPDPAPVEVTASYNYTKPQILSVPEPGEAIHSNRDPGIISFHKTDSTGTDRAALLTSLKPGDTITGNPVTRSVLWSVQAVLEQGAYVNVYVAPTVQEADSGLLPFVFSTITPQPVTFMRDTNWWLANTPEGGVISGLYVEDESYSDVVADQNAYGVDLLVQDAYVSPDWDLVAVSSAASAGGGGGGGAGSAQVSDTPPLSPGVGDLWYASTEPTGLYIWLDDGDSSQWVQTNGGAGSSGQFLPLTGGTLTGNLTIDPGYLTVTTALTTGYVMEWNGPDNALAAWRIYPEALDLQIWSLTNYTFQREGHPWGELPDDVMRRGDNDARYLQLSGGTTTGDITIGGTDTLFKFGGDDVAGNEPFREAQVQTQLYFQREDTSVLRNRWRIRVSTLSQNMFISHMDEADPFATVGGGMSLHADIGAGADVRTSDSEAIDPPADTSVISRQRGDARYVRLASDNPGLIGLEQIWVAANGAIGSQTGNNVSTTEDIHLATNGLIGTDRSLRVGVGSEIGLGDGLSFFEVFDYDNTETYGTNGRARRMMTIGRTSATETVRQDVRDEFRLWPDSDGTGISLILADGSGSVGMTVNDGQGNAQVTFNHVAGIPDNTGSSGRIVCNVDNSSAVMIFELASSTTEGVAVGTTPIMQLTPTSGTLYIAAGWTISSDERLKRDIRPLNRGVEAVRGIVGKHFIEESTGIERLGLVAQDVQKVLPEAVVEAPSYKMMDDEYVETSPSLGVQEMPLFAALFDAINEIIDRLERLEGGA